MFYSVGGVDVDKSETLCGYYTRTVWNMIVPILIYYMIFSLAGIAGVGLTDIDINQYSGYELMFYVPLYGYLVLTCTIAIVYLFTYTIGCTISNMLGKPKKSKSKRCTQIKFED